VDYREVDYRTGASPIRTLWPVVEASVTTSTLARMAIMAFKRVGPEYGRDAFDGLARLWGSRVAQLFKAQLRTVGSEQMPLLTAKTILVFNHLSYLDFALNFFALGSIRAALPGGGKRHLRPRFIAAKDHFIDNPFIYSWINLGKVIENAGMIFVNRSKGKGWTAMEQAARKLCENDVEIALYPQGTRAYLMKTPAGERLDGGYYTTFTRKTWNESLGHLKPGVAYLILDSLMQLKQKGEKELHVIISGIRGTGTAGGKGSFFVQTEAQIEFRVAPLWTLSTDWVEGVRRPQDADDPDPSARLYLKKVEEILSGLNQRMAETLRWHAYLRERMRSECKALNIPEVQIETMDRLLETADLSGHALPFILIDRIFSLKPELWNRFIRLFYSLKDEPLSGNAWTALLQEVSERLLSRKNR
jgi:1-acyl-sn-glycerol-3-phosphate acyltransferase